ncbi:hypothetical protein Tco_0948317 [Tanacetum coccineum]
MRRYLMETPPVPQDEDEREPMFIQPHNPDYVPEPIYPEYIPLEDEHEFPAEEQPLPPVDSPTAKSPRYVTESDPEEDPEEYEDDETEDGPVDYPMDGGDDGDDDDGDSSGDDANEDEDDEDEEEEEEGHIAPADSTIAALVDEPVFPPRGNRACFPFPFTRGRGWSLLACISPPSPPILSIYHPLRGRALVTLRIASTQAFVDAVTATLPSPPLPHLYTYHTCDVGYEVGESSTARPTGCRGIDYGFVSTVDAEARRQGISEVGYDIRDTWVDPAEAVYEIAPMTLGEETHVIMCMHRDPIQAHQDTAIRRGYSYSDTALDGRDSPSDERHEMRDGCHACRVVGHCHHRGQPRARPQDRC